MIETTGFILQFHGDPSVGIFPSYWEITGDFYFDDQIDFDQFVEKLKDTWELVCGERVDVMTFENYQKMLNLENE